ncbi:MULTISPECIES: helix-turn-helix transcriptional regulator [unclassified Streptomyces]|uniref:helix-turn-helix transcriptional regulator n=1 Tax=unclassified Streptomyces TaxID=2593676 RepID=UPI00081DAAC6|nr:MULTISPECIES: helix-turn-helix transcriptional regulator [unclassified Streptomyces]MYZ35974.1 helix-turn-helix domain-containing protein [Streptomyces sp. SID4917]SCF79895.1 Helix-turn-helix domain-containing protein [Streptomyces sp. MnatMP-M17]
MARGTAKFDAKILQGLRASREVDGRKLSAADLARLLGTSKARVLAYEAGTSVPEPGRIREIAQVFRVHSRELYEPTRGRYDQIRDLRSYAGLTATQLAARIGVSRATYRDIEALAILPARDDGTLPLRLSEALGIPLSMVHRALDHHPEAAARRAAIAERLTEIFDRAHVQYQPAVVNPDEPLLVEITSMLRRSSGVVCRLVNHELGLYRNLLRRLAVVRLSVAYAQSVKAAEEAGREGDRLEELIIEHPVRAASNLVRFLAEAMTSQQWRTAVVLLETGSAWAPESADQEETQVWEVLVARGIVSVERERSAFADGVRVSITPEGWRRCTQQAPLYGCLYPRIASPRVSRPAPRRFVYPP